MSKCNTYDIRELAFHRHQQKLQLNHTKSDQPTLGPHVDIYIKRTEINNGFQIVNNFLQHKIPTYHDGGFSKV
jgi:hypothetical protein